jgi:hypothetical protein
VEPRCTSALAYDGGARTACAGGEYFDPVEHSCLHLQPCGRLIVQALLAVECAWQVCWRVQDKVCEHVWLFTALCTASEGITRRDPSIYTSRMCSCWHAAHQPTTTPPCGAAATNGKSLPNNGTSLP